jgi:hypothetical protein
MREERIDHSGVVSGYSMRAHFSYTTE